MRRVFFSFDWDDVWRVNQVRNSWVTQGEKAGFEDKADFEKIAGQGDGAIMKWIDSQLSGTSVTCVLIGSKTATSTWVNYEIQKSVEKANGLLGIYIHNIKDEYGYTSNKGKNPFLNPPLHSFRPASYYDWDIDDGRNNLGDWIEEAAQEVGR